MARICQVTGTKGSVGNSRSHSNRGVKRTFRVNLIKKMVFDPETGRAKRIRIAASTLRTLTKKMQG